MVVNTIIIFIIDPYRSFAQFCEWYFRPRGLDHLGSSGRHQPQQGQHHHAHVWCSATSLRGLGHQAATGATSLVQPSMVMVGKAHESCSYGQLWPYQLEILRNPFIDCIISAFFWPVTTRKWPELMGIQAGQLRDDCWCIHWLLWCKRSQHFTTT